MIFVGLSINKKIKKKASKRMKFKILLLILLLILSIFATNTGADVLFPGERPIDRCIKLVNVDEFSNVIFVGYITGPVTPPDDRYIITSDMCLSKYYKYNDLTIYAIAKNDIDAIGLANLDLGSDSYLYSYNVEINPGFDIVSTADPLQSEMIEYTVAGFSNASLIIYKSKQVSEYSAGIPDKVEIFDQPDIQDLSLTIKGNEENGYEKDDILSRNDSVTLNDQGSNYYDNLYPFSAHQFLLALLVTVIIETLLLFTMVRYYFKIDRSTLSDNLILFAGAFSSSLTLPILWYLLPVFIVNYSHLALVGEAFVILAETVIYCSVLKLYLKRSFFISIICNLTSFSAGMIFYYIF